jgi:hypothetical protein
MAGESADESARRMRDKARRLERAAEQYERGRDGERATAVALAELPVDLWTVIHDVRWPGRARANIDHVVVGPSGVFVVDSKNWSGAIAVREGVLRQNGWKRDREASGAIEAARVVAGLLPEAPLGMVRPVLCFVRDEPVSDTTNGVLLCSTSNIAALLESIPPTLDDDSRHDVARRLAAGLSSHVGTATPLRPARPQRSATNRLIATGPTVRAGRRPSGRRTRTRRGVIRRIVAGAIGLTLLGAAFTQPQIFEWFGETFVNVIADDDEPTRPAEVPKKDRPHKERPK